MRIRLLGATAAFTDTGVEVGAGSIKQRGVLAQLALEPNRPINLDRIAEGIWGEQVPDRYRQNVQVYVSSLRRVLEPDRVPGTPSRIIGHAEAYELVAAEDDIDVSRFEAGLSEAQQAMAAERPQAAADSLAAALAEWGGDPLADLFAMPFAAGWINRLEASRLQARELEFEARLALGQHREIVGDLESMVKAFPERDVLWCQLATSLVRSGRQVEALATVRAAREWMIEEYGLDSGPVLAALEGKILNQDPDLLGIRPPVIRQAVVPVPVGAAIGREHEVTEVLALLAAGARLITLTGPGGVGKTRLALEVLNDSDGARALWVSMADRLPDVPVGDALASELGVAAARLSSELSAGPWLIGLDNLEHIDGAAGQVESLLTSFPSVTVLATSRGRLGVAGEHVVMVTPLSAVTSGFELFVERARAALPGFDAEANHEIVVALCERLDGLPLAIELAASRVGVFDPSEILAALPSVRELRDDHARSPRQSSLEAAVEWSVRLLEEPERRALTALASLDGPIDLRAAQAAVASVARDDIDRPARDIGGAIEALARVGLIQPQETRAGRRFAMLDTVRSVVRESTSYAREPAGAATAVLGVADLWLATADAEGMHDQWPPARINALVVDLPVLRQAVRELVAARRFDDAAQLVCTQRRGFWASGTTNQCLDLLRTIPHDGLDERWQAKSAVIAGCAMYVTGEATAVGLLGAVDDLAAIDAAYLVHGLCNRAALRADHGETEAARADVAAALAAAHDDALALVALSAATWVSLAAHDTEAAIEHARRAVDVAGRSLGGRRGAGERELVIAVNDLAHALLVADDLDQALAISQDNLIRARRLGIPVQLSETLAFLGCGLARVGREHDALACLDEAAALVAEHSDWGQPLDIVIEIAVCAALAGRRQDAQSLLDAAAARARASGYEGDVINELVSPIAATIGLAADPTRIMLAPTLPELVSTARVLVVSTLASAPANKP